MGLLRNIRKGFMFLRHDTGITPEDEALLDAYLSAAERELFLRMDEGDQVHSVRVARVCAESLENHPQLNERHMTRAALLHDVGKAGADLGLAFRTFWVLGHRMCPWLMDWIARRGESSRQGTLRHKMYLQLFHPQIGVELLEEVGVEDEVLRLISYTAERREPSDCLEKTVLLLADADRVLGEGN